MLIKLTNAAKEHKGKTLLLNAEYIMSVFPSEAEENEKVTIVYSTTQQSWSVKESVDGVLKKVKECCMVK